MGAVAPDAEAKFRSLLHPWGERPIGGTPVWPSDIVDDHTPFEISVTVGGHHSEVRVLVEAQGDTPTLQAQQEAGRALTRRLEQEFGADLKRLRLVEDLFLPEDPRGIFAVWHAASFRSDGKLDLKIYLNLQARGRPNAPAVAEEALARLGFGRAWPALSRIGARRGLDLDELIYFSLDLSPRVDARTKIYFRHHHPTAADLERALTLSPRTTPGEITKMCRALADEEGPLSMRAPVSCFSYTAGDTTNPSEATIYFPITGYVTDDRETQSRISAYLTSLGVSAAPYEAAVNAIASRPLESGAGMQSYVSFRYDRGVPRLTVYFGPEAYSAQPPSTRPFSRRRGPILPSPEHIVRRHEAEPLTNHPFFRRLRREPANTARLWKLMANVRVALIDDFPRMLSSLVARIDDDRLRCVLAKQLDDELGHGDYARARKGLFAKLMQAIEPWRPMEDEPSLLGPGQALRGELERLYLEADPCEGVGATLMGTVFADQLRRFAGEQLDRQGSMYRSDLKWLSPPKSEDEEHAEAAALAGLLPDGPPRVAASRGAQAVVSAAWACFDGMYELCFG
jgi:DMATS type aromatic prenyltransferase